MNDPYQRLLDATIEHLQQLKEQGIHFVSVSPERLLQLSSASIPVNCLPQPEALPETEPSSDSTAGLLLSSTDGKTGIEKPQKSSGERCAVAGAALEPAAKTAVFEELRQRVMACVKCAHLASSRKNVVFGVGDIHAPLMFIGEAPGTDEDQQGEPFVGKAGQLLTRIIQTMGLTRNSVYIANILKCRPDTPGQTAGNRKPTPEEMQTCIPYLHRQIDLIQPKVIVALGGTAIEGLLGKGNGIMRIRGHWQSYRGIPLMPTYHPAYLLRNQALSEKRRVWEDMLQVMDKLQLPISEKQKNYFLSAGA